MVNGRKTIIDLSKYFKFAFFVVFKKNPEPIHRIWEQPVSYNRLARKWLECQELQIRRKFMELDHLA